MAIDRSKMRRGAEAIDQANEDNANRGDGGTFVPFLSSIYWGDDGDEQYVLILNPMEDIPQVDYHPFVDLGDGRPHSIICRTDPIIGEAVDPIRSTWKYKPRLTNLAIAVLLEPVTETVKGREKPVGFQVITRTFERTILDADGKPTDEKEEVEAPEVGVIAQSPLNFFNQLRAYDAAEAPLHTTPLKITRLGKKDVSYTVVGYDTITPDVSNLLDLIQNVSYVKDVEDLLEQVDNAEDDEAACIAIGNYLLDLRIDELGDADNYQALFDQITEPSRYPEGGDKKKATKKAARPTRSSRRSAPAEDADDSAPEAEAETPKATGGKAQRDERIAKLRQRKQAAAA